MIKKRRRRGTDGRSFTIRPPDHRQKGSKDLSIKYPFGNKYDNPIRNLGKITLAEENYDPVEDFLDQRTKDHNKMTDELRSTLKSLENTINISRQGVLLESNDNIDPDIEIELDE